MDFINNWFQIGSLPANVITGNYFNLKLVALSYVIAVLASYVALDMAGRLRTEPDKRTKFYWLVGGAFAMGAGIWSMHFIGMLAFIMPMPMSYNLVWTGLSMLAAIIAAGFALFLLRTENRPLSYMVIGGVMLGVGICTMHYMGMEAMKEHVNIHYYPGLFFLSVLIAIVASEVALWLALQSNQGTFKRQLRLKFISALIMGAAICGMHYTGMAAAVFTPLAHEMTSSEPGIATYALAFYIAGITILIISVALVASTYKQLLGSALQNEKNFLNAILDNLADGIVACDAQGKINVFNQALQKMLNIKSETRVFSDLTNYCYLHHPNDEIPITKENNPLTVALSGKSIHAMELVMMTKQGTNRNIVIDGQQIVSSEGKKLGAVIAVHDITERKQMEEQLLQQATHDILTGLPNRTLLIDRIDQNIKLANRTNSITAVLFLDIDEFKLINDTFGHSAGDELLLIISKRLQKCIRENDTVARLGGDEFVVTLSSISDEENVITLANKILNDLSQPIRINNREFKVTVSIGISVYPKNGGSADSLLKNADTAMYRVKTAGRNHIKFYSEEMNLRTAKRLELEQYLYEALSKKEFVLYYQPIVDVHTGYVTSLEALLRWEHPTLGFLLPLEFIALLEESGLIISVGEWVLRTACAQNKKWQEQGLPKLRVSVNVSSRQFSEYGFIDKVKETLNATQLDPKYLELELTESVILHRPMEALETFRELKNIGVNISLDDFGTGFSSLAYLSRLQVDKVKIDRSFVHNIQDKSDNAAIILAIINMASSMKLKVTAEGAETDSELAFLRFNRCDEVQGYYFSHPLSVEDCTEFLQKNPKLC